MKSSLNEVTRFATLLTTNPSTEELLLTLLRDFLSEQQVIAVEVQILSPLENLVLRHSAGVPIDGTELKSSESVSTLIANENIYSDLAKFGSIYNPKNHVTQTAITVDTSRLARKQCSSQKPRHTYIYGQLVMTSHLHLSL